jgi:hypothetical protein
LLKNPAPDNGRSIVHYEVSHHLSSSRRPRGARPAEIPSSQRSRDAGAAECGAALSVEVIGRARQSLDSRVPGRFRRRRGYR